MADAVQMHVTPRESPRTSITGLVAFQMRTEALYRCKKVSNSRKCASGMRCNLPETRPSARLRVYRTPNLLELQMLFSNRPALGIPTSQYWTPEYGYRVLNKVFLRGFSKLG